jgi:FkbM family methyltransferase
MDYKRDETIIHVGANYGHEVMKYEDLGLYGYHIEAIPKVFQELQLKCEQTTRQKPICACLSDQESADVMFNVTSNNAESSSMLDLGRHKMAYPHIGVSEQVRLTTSTLDGLASQGLLSPPNHIVIDVQGAELMVLKGSPITLASRQLKTVTVESSAEPLYDGGAKFSEIFNYLTCFGFFLKEASFNHHGWCDALFAKPWWPSRAFSLNDISGKNIAVDSICSQSSFSNWSIDFNEASRVVCGPANGSYSFHTDFELNPWISLDLGSTQQLSEIIVYNRVVDGPDVAARAYSLGIFISCDGEDWELVYGKNIPFGGVDGNPLRVKCDEIIARFIKLQILEGSPQALHLDLIEIYSMHSLQPGTMDFESGMGSGS